MEIESKRFGYVYRTTNLVNGKIYIGKHRSKKEPWLSYLGSGQAISRAIRKYGKEFFEKDLVCYADSEDELSTLETFHINQAIANGSILYNIISSESEKLNGKSKLMLDNFPILEWYFEEKLTTTEIADRVKTSQPVIQSYISSKRSTDSRFSSTKRGVGISGRKRPPVSESTKEKLKSNNVGGFKLIDKSNCTFCKEEFFSANLANHQLSCKENPKRNWPVCEFCGSKVVNYRARWCGNHKYKSQRA